MAARTARDDEIETWQRDGWVLLDGLIGTEEIDAAASDLWEMFPTPAQYHADPGGESRRWLGEPPAARDPYVWPATGPGFRPEQHRWNGQFPFPGSGALNRLAIHPSIVDFAERALQMTELRLYQVQVSAKYTGAANYEQPMHTDRNHSWLPARGFAPWWHLESFLYLSDVGEGCAPTHLVRVGESAGRATTVPLVMPANDPELYAAERAAAGIRGSLLAYRSDVFHRGVDLTAPGGARFLLGVAYKGAGQDWIGYHSPQHRSTGPAWVALAEQCTPRQLELFGFPPPGHPIWDEALLHATADRYPKLDLAPWRAAITNAE